MIRHLLPRLRLSRAKPEPLPKAQCAPSIVRVHNEGELRDAQRRANRSADPLLIERVFTPEHDLDGARARALPKIRAAMRARGIEPEEDL